MKGSMEYMSLSNASSVKLPSTNTSIPVSRPTVSNCQPTEAISTGSSTSHQYTISLQYCLFILLFVILEMVADFLVFELSPDVLNFGGKELKYESQFIVSGKKSLCNGDPDVIRFGMFISRVISKPNLKVSRCKRRSSLRTCRISSGI